MGLVALPPLTRRPDPHCQNCNGWRVSQTTCVSGRGSDGMRGPYPKPLDILFVGEMPGPQEDQEGVCFIGQSGRFFDVFANGYLSGLSWELVNGYRCYLGRQPNKTFVKPSVKEMRACRPFLEREVGVLRPRVIVPMGKYAVAQVLGVSVNSIKLSSLLLTPTQTQWKDRKGSPIPCFPINHPANCLHEGVSFDGIGPGVDLWERQWEKLLAFLNEEGESLPGRWVFADDWDKEQLELWYEEHLFGKTFAYDYETTGLDRKDDTFRMIGYSPDGKQALVHPLKEEWQLELHKRALLEGEETYIHNFAMELPWALEKLKTEPQGFVFDTKVLDFLVDENRSKKLEDLVDIHLPHLSGFKRKTEAWGNPCEAPDNLLAERCAFDCMATFQLGELLWGQLTPQQQELYTDGIEEALRGISGCMQVGWRFDVEKLRALFKEGESKKKEILEKIRTLPEAIEVETLKNPVMKRTNKRKQPGDYGYKYFSPGSRKDGPDLLRKLGISDNERQPNDPTRMRMAKEVLEQHLDDHWVVGSLMDYSDYVKLVGTFIKVLLNETERTGGYVYPNYGWGGAAQDDDPEGTVTGRLSCGKPNLQNLPSPKRPHRLELAGKIRECVVSRWEGGKLLAADYEQGELRVMAMLAPEPGWAEAFAKGEDPHMDTARRMGIEREPAKTVNYAVSYFGAKYRIAALIGCSVEEASALLANFWEVKPDLQDWFAKAKREGVDKGYVEGVFGMRVHCPDIYAGEHGTREHAARRISNYKVQNALSMLCTMAMGPIRRRLAENGHKTLLFGNLHDGLYLDWHPDDDIDLIKQIVQEEMVDRLFEKYDWMTLPIPIDLKLTDTMAG